MKKILTGVAALIALAACNKNNPSDAVPVTELTAAREAAETRSHLDANKVLWDANDEISVFSLADGAYSNVKFVTAEGGATAVFKGPGITVDDNIYAFYPYAEGNSFTAEGGFSFVADYATQKVVDGSFDAILNIAAGKYAGENKVNFKNVGTLLRFKLTQERADTIRRIELKSNDGTPIAFTGAAAVNWNGGDPQILTAPGAELTDVVKLQPAGTAFATGDTYYVWVLPGQYAGGITITLVSPTQMTAAKAGTSALNAARSQVIDLGDIGGLAFKAKETEKKSLHFDFTGDAQTGWPTTDKWKDVAKGDPNPCPGDSTCIYKLDGVDYKFILTDCGNATQARVAWVKDKGGLIMYAGWRYLGLPALEGFRLIKITGDLCLATNSKRKAGVAKFVVANNTTDENEFVTGGEPIVWGTNGEQYTFNLEGTEADTVYYLTCTATSIGTSFLDLVYEKVE